MTALGDARGLAQAISLSSKITMYRYSKYAGIQRSGAVKSQELL
jgi:hypothetical protein